MHRIHFDNRSIIVCSPHEHSLHDPNALIMSSKSENEIASVSHYFDKAKHIHKLCIITDDEKRVFSTICKQFKEIDAGGGLVTNRAGDYLLIFRNNLWDLPKGMQEQGEEIEVCALREVREETGLEDISLKDPICITHHTYHRNGEFCLKHTYWYNMVYNSPIDLVPQNEEDIEKAAWVAKSSLPELLVGTYPSITEVFKKARIL